MKILVTGAAGFISLALTLRLLKRGDEVIGIDNHNDYYSPVLKEARLARQESHPNYTHIRIDLADRAGMAELFKTHRPQRVANLTAQVGVRYSLENPLSYIDRILVKFLKVAVITVSSIWSIPVHPAYMAQIPQCHFLYTTM